MAEKVDSQRAEKLASAKKKLKQFQQKHRDVHVESGRSTPLKKKMEQDGLEKSYHSENGGSTHSLCHSENISSNISATDSPVPTLGNSLENICHILNGSSQPDIRNTTNGSNVLPIVSENLFKSPSPQSFFAEPLAPNANSRSASEFFDSLNTEPPDGDDSCSMLNRGMLQLVDASMFQPPHVNASTPNGPQSENTPNYSFPDISYSPIDENRTNPSSEVVSQEAELQLKNSSTRNEELENQLTVQLQNVNEDLKKKVEEAASSLSHHVQAIHILVSEKTELQNSLEKLQEELNSKTGEMGELQGRLRASRHRVTDLERELATAKTQLQTQETTIRELGSSQATFMDQSESQRKRIGDLELEISDLQNKLEVRDETLKAVKGDLEEKISKLSLSEIRIQQLSGGHENDRAAEEELQRKNEELVVAVSNLEQQLSSTTVRNEESVKEYQRYVNNLHHELQELKNEHLQCEERCRQLEDREHQLVQQVNSLERQLSTTHSADLLPELQSVRQLLNTADETNSNLRAHLTEKDGEIECLRVGLQERALRIQELEMTVTRLEAEWPDTSNLQAAIESDKVAASRAMTQNNSLKIQLQELQDVVVKLSKDKEELAEQLEKEKQTNRLLTANLGTMQAGLEDVKKTEEAEKSQQTETPSLQECEVQTLNHQPEVSPEILSKLEEKVRKTMGEIADLKDEKQRLEHLVLQLQGETETIGEYITLYQIQRGMLRQRAQEKDEQVAQLARDKEALRNKLTHLNCLVQRLVGQQSDSQSSELVTEAESENVDNETNMAPPVSESTNKETADQIRSLLTEIGSNNLVITNLENTNINFHPCPCCSGRLITV